MAETYKPIYKNEKILDGNISYYAVTAEDVGTSDETKLLIPPSSAVINCFYLPYLKSSSITTLSVNLSKIKLPDGDNQNLSMTVKRVLDMNEVSSVVGLCEVLTLKPSSVGGAFNWRNESKLNFYPYCFRKFNDGVSKSPVIFEQHIDTNRLIDGNKQNIEIRQALNQQGQYLLYFVGYMGDASGLRCGTLTSGVPVPTSTNAYTDYMANNRMSINANYITATAGFLANTLANPSSVIGGAVGMGTNIYSQYAKERDLARQFTYNAVNNDYVLNMANNQFVYIDEYRYSECKLERIAKHFHLYGYAQNKVMQPYFKGRKYWNYLQTQDCHLKVANCPKEHLQQLKQIFDEGFTVWHKANGDMFENMDRDNVEI